MKILTINTHSLQEENYQQKLEWFIQGVIQERPDLIAMQEVNQSINAPEAPEAMLTGLYPMPGGIPIRVDNHAAQVASQLRKAGIPCSWVWLPLKLGYGKYDEGIALLSLGRPIRNTDAILISKCNDYYNWKTRKVLGVQLEGMEDWFYTIHMGWWQDAEEPFQRQWLFLNGSLATKRQWAPIWLMGDFNAPAEVRGEGYDCVQSSGWLDTYDLAAQRDEGITVPGIIDGWRDKILDLDAPGMRIDQIWCSQSRNIARSAVVFNGKNHPAVSDHFGVLIETKGVIKQ